MSSNFLQRFKGKTTQISKDGVHEILGSKKPQAVYNPNQEYKERNYNSVNNKQNKSTNSNFIPQKKKQPTPKVASVTAKENPKKAQNPFLVSNPFYLDEQQRQREQIQRKQRIRLQQQTKKAQQQAQKDTKQITKTSGYSRSLQKKKGNNKQWVKLGGLGANIGGDEWVQKKKKKDKMQQFSQQVKSINADRVKPPRPQKKQQPKQVNARQKALQYSKNVPRPAPRRQRQQREEQQHQKPTRQEAELTQLQLCEMKREQLKKMLNNQY